MTVIAEVVTCRCGAETHPTATTCSECAGPLLVPAVPLMGGDVDVRCLQVAGCSCGHSGICVRCVLHLLDNGIAL